MVVLKILAFSTSKKYFIYFSFFSWRKSYNLNKILYFVFNNLLQLTVIYTSLL